MLNVVTKAKELLTISLQFIEAGQYNDARDSCMKGLTLLEVANSTDSVYELPLKACRKSIEDILKQLNVQNNFVFENKSIEYENLMSSNAEERFEDFSSVIKRNIHIDYSDIIGCNRVKRSLYENVILPFTLSKHCKSSIFHGIRAGSGNVLLHGPPGTGKTLLAQATATEAGALFYAVRPSDVLSKYQGESERYLKQVFEQARKSDRSIVFFDEFDSIAASRDGGDDNAQSRRLLSELLLQMTHNKQVQKQQKESRMRPQQPSYRVLTPPEQLGVDNTATNATSIATSRCDGQVVVLAATNRLEDLDEAVIRRFDSKIYVGVPEHKKIRIQMIHSFLEGIEYVLSEQELGNIAEMTNGWSGSDIEINILSQFYSDAVS